MHIHQIITEGPKQLIEKNKINYIKPRFDTEWSEAERYPEFVKLGKEEWIKLANKGKPITITQKTVRKINNTDAANPDSFNLLEPQKQKRVLADISNNSVEMPIVAKYSDGYLELIGGNTRLTALMKQYNSAKVWIFDVPKQLIENNGNIQPLQYLLHGSPNNNLTLNDIKIFNPNAKQNKKGRIYGGFYTTDPTDINQAQKYATPSGSIYKIFIHPNAKIITKNGDITRLSQNTIEEYRNNNIDIIQGKDPRGYTEYAIINLDIITDIAKLPNLTESTGERINEIKDASTKFFNKLLKTFDDMSKENDEEFIYTGQIPLYIRLYPEFYFPVIFDFNNSNNAVAGSYQPQGVIQNQEIIIYLNILFKKQEITKKDLQKNRKYILSIIAHEIRHYYQDISFDKKFMSKDMDKTYKDRHHEIDAAFFQALLNNNNAKKAIQQLKSERNISPKKEIHYYKKAINYYANKNKKSIDLSKYEKILDKTFEELPEMINDYPVHRMLGTADKFYRSELDKVDISVYLYIAAISENKNLLRLLKTYIQLKYNKPINYFTTGYKSQDQLIKNKIKEI